MKHTKQKKRVVKEQAFGILNMHGDFWTPRTFVNANEAEWYMKNFWNFVTDKKQRPDVSKHKVVEVTVTYTHKK